MGLSGVLATVSTHSLRGVASTETDTPIAVIVGDDGVIFRASGYDGSDETIDPYAWSQTNAWTSIDLQDVVYGNDVFVAVGNRGMVCYSGTGLNWEVSSESADEYGYGDLRSVLAIDSDEWLLAGELGIMLCDDLDSGYVVYATGDYNCVAGSAALAVAVGNHGLISTSSDTTTWVAEDSGTINDLNEVAYDGSSLWVAVGEAGTILTASDPTGTWTTAVSGVDVILHTVAYGDGVWVVAGDGGVTLSSPDGSTWTVEDNDDAFTIYAVRYVDSRFVAVGSAAYVAYSTSGIAIPQWDGFQPISDDYRSNDAVVAGASVTLVGLYEFDSDTGKWVYKPRRTRTSVPGDFDDFDSAGSAFTDWPGGGQLLQGLALDGTVILLAESDQISILEPGVYSMWEYRPLAAGLWAISNLVEVNGMGYFVGSDGLLYQASSMGCKRVVTGFDLAAHEDWNAEAAGKVWMRYSPVLQQILILQVEPSYTLHLIEDESGAHTTVALPAVVISGDTYTPMGLSTFSAPSNNAVYVSYGITGAGNSQTSMVTLELDFDSAVTGKDEINEGGSTSRWDSEIRTGLFRLGQPGKKVVIREIEVHAWCDTAATAYPSLTVEISSTAEDDWYKLGETGTITVGTSTCTGSGVAFSNKIAEGDDASTVFTIPCRATKATPYFYVDDLDDDDSDDFTPLTSSEYSITDTKEITLTDPLPSGTDLYVYWPGAPPVCVNSGDFIRTSSGMHRITAVDNYASLTLDWYPDAQTAGVHVPALQMQAGDNVLTFGVFKEVEELQASIRTIPVDDSGSPVWTKVTKVVVLLGDTGEELRDESDK